MFKGEAYNEVDAERDQEEEDTCVSYEEEDTFTHAERDQEEEKEEEEELLQLLRVEAEAGTLVVFPSFVPHFVMPVTLTSAACASPACRQRESGGGAGGSTTCPARISIAFNYNCPP